MAPSTAYRYTLQPYAGPRSRYSCPSCNKPRCFTRYLDTDTGELLPERFGKCDREANCGYYHNPYQDTAGGISYARQVRSTGYTPTSFATTHKPAQVKPPVVLTIPDEVFGPTLDREQYPSNSLAKLLRERLGWGVADELMQRFKLGTSAYWPGACVFWLIDEQGRTRGGQVVLYDETGHTVKEPKRHVTWAHSALSYAFEQRGQPLPFWLSEYIEHGQKCPCLFGLPQLDAAPNWQPVALVESAKTAMLATPYMPEYVWLATMGLSFLTAERLEPLRGRRIVLFPDAGALDKWQGKAEELRPMGFNIQVSGMLEDLATPEQRKAGLDLADVLLNEWPGYPPSWD